MKCEVTSWNVLGVFQTVFCCLLLFFFPHAGCFFLLVRPKNDGGDDGNGDDGYGDDGNGDETFLMGFTM